MIWLVCLSTYLYRSSVAYKKGVDTQDLEQTNISAKIEATVEVYLYLAIVSTVQGKKTPVEA